MNISTLNITILDEGIDISSISDEFPDKNYINIMTKYNPKFIIEIISCNYSFNEENSGEFKKVKSIQDRTFQFTDIDIKEEIGITPADMEDLYKSTIKNKPTLKSDIVEFPGNICYYIIFSIN